MLIQESYQKALRFASEKHAEIGQTLPDSIVPYAVHLSNVAMEVLVAVKDTKNFDVEFAVQLALLHDVLEDTTLSVEALRQEFGVAIANGVLALTKNKHLPKTERMADSIQRLKTALPEVRSVKLADRITNLQKPPVSWSLEKKQNYLREAEYILAELGGSNEYLEKRLELKIKKYKLYCC